MATALRITGPATPLAPEIRLIPIDQVHESPLNTRQHFDPVKLQELADSMRKSGQLTPALARPSKLPDKPGYELAAGHRRRRAASIAGMDELLLIVRDLDDRTFLEILTIDNLQREDVHPLEEAQGYRNLLTIDGYDPKQIAERVGKSESYVYDRLKLLQLVPDAQTLFLEHRFTLGHAIILARVPASAQQAILDDTMGAGGLWRRDHGHATLDLIRPEAETGKYARLIPTSVRQLQQWVDEHVRFDPKDEAVPQLFPSTAATLTAAAAAKMKIVPITSDYHVHPDAKDASGARTYGPTSWKRADGQPDPDRLVGVNDDFRRGGEPSEVCDYSVIGLVAVGDGRGESFRVCVDKKRCTVHWGKEIAERNKRERAKEAAPSTSKATGTKSPESSWAREDRLRRERVALAKTRWAKGGDAVLGAIVPHVKKIAVGGNVPAVEYFLEVIQDGLYGVRDTGKRATKLGVPRGSTPADLIRHLIMVSLLVRAEPSEYQATNEEDLQEDLNDLKIKVDVVKLLDAANPAPKPEPQKAAPAAKKKASTKRAAKKAKAKRA